MRKIFNNFQGRSNQDYKGFKMIYHSIHPIIIWGTWFFVENKKKRIQSSSLFSNNRNKKQLFDCTSSQLKPSGANQSRPLVPFFLNCYLYICEVFVRNRNCTQRRYKDIHRGEAELHTTCDSNTNVMKIKRKKIHNIVFVNQNCSKSPKISGNCLRH